MDRNEPFLFPRFGWRGRFDPGDLSLAVHQFADTLFEGWNDFSQSFTLAGRGASESRQISDTSPDATASVGRHVDNAIEDGNFGWLRVVADVPFDAFVLPLFSG
jgi:hypothetical protein